MREWFSDLADIENPGAAELACFLEEFQALLQAILRDDELMTRLCRRDTEFRDLARRSFSDDVLRGFSEMQDRLSPHVSRAPAPLDNSIQRGLEEHGLVGVSARFKYRALAKLAKLWCGPRGVFTAGARFRRVLEAADVVLVSTISVVGVGGVVQEFKDTLKALSLGKSGD